MEKIQTKKMKRRFNGIVVTDSAEKTIKVSVTRVVQHPKYKKRYKVHSMFLVHDPKNQFHVGDNVKFEETRPISKLKRWVVVYN